MSLRAAVAMRLSRSPLAPITIGFWLSRSIQMVASMRRRLGPSLVLEALERHVAAVGQFLAEQQEQLFAQDLRGEEALVAVGELVRRIGRRAFRQQSGRSTRSSSGRFVPVCALTPARWPRNRAPSAAARGTAAARPILHQVDLVDRGDDLLRGRDALQHLAVRRIRSASPRPRTPRRRNRARPRWRAGSASGCSTFTCSVWYPGRSTNTYWQSAVVRMPVTDGAWSAAWARRSRSSAPISWLSRLDLPVFGRPTSADRAAAERAHASIFFSRIRRGLLLGALPRAARCRWRPDPGRRRRIRRRKPGLASRRKSTPPGTAARRGAWRAGTPAGASSDPSSAARIELRQRRAEGPSQSRPGRRA